MLNSSRPSHAMAGFVVLVLSCIASAQTAFVRVNQVGYSSGGSKRAYLMASTAETGATFSIKNSSGRFSGDLTPATFNGSPVTLNAMGGWWDAGDYLKFVQTHSYLMAEMLVGVRDFPNQMGATGITQNGLHFTDEAKFGLDWL